MNAVQSAIKYADDPKHGGAGYTLRVFLVRSMPSDNVVIEGAVVAHGAEWLHIEALKNRPIFISTNFVESVEIVW